MPEVTLQEEEGEHELRCTQLLAEVLVVHQVGLGDDAAHGVDRNVGSVGHGLRSATHLPGLNVVLKLVVAQAGGAHGGTEVGAEPSAHTLSSGLRIDFTTIRMPSAIVRAWAESLASNRSTGASSSWG